MRETHRKRIEVLCCGLWIEEGSRIIIPSQYTQHRHWM